MTDDNDFTFDDDEEGEATESPSQDSAVLRDLRKKYEQTRKALKERDKIIEELTPFKERVRNLEVGSVFKEVGLSEKQAGLFPKDAEPTTENVRSWAEQYGLVTAPAEEKPEPAGEPFPPQVRGEAPSSSQTWTWDQYAAKVSDPTTRLEAMRARKAGLVDESTHPNNRLLKG